MAVLEDNTSLINPFAENFPSPGLGEQAQPPPYAASPTRSLSNRGSPSWSGISGICELSNTTRIWSGTYPVTEMGTAANAAALRKSEMSEGETSHRKRVDDHSVNTEYNDEDELYRMPQVMVELAAGMMVSPLRTNSPQPLGDYPGNLDEVMLWNFEEHSEFEEVQGGKEVMRPICKQPDIEVDAASALGKNQILGIWAAVEPESMGGMAMVQQRNDGHSVNGDGLSHMPIQLPVDMMVSSPRMNSSPPSGDSPGNFDWVSLLNSEFDTTLGKNQSLGISPEKMGGMVQQSWDTHPQTNDGLSRTPIIQLPVDMMVSSPRMNSSLPSGDSPGNFDWVSLLNSEFEELQNGMEIMRPIWKQPRIQVDTTLGKNQSLGISPERMGGMVQQSWGTHPQTNDGLSRTPIIQLPVDMMPSSPCPGINCSLPPDPDSLWDDVKNSVVQELPNWEEIVREFCLSFGAAFFLCSEGVSQSIGEKLQLPNRIKILRLTVTAARIEVNFSSENNFTIGLLLELEPESWGGMMEQNSLTHPQTNDEQICQFKLVSLEMLLYQVFRFKPTLLEELRNTGGKRLAVETKCSGGKMVHTVSYYTKSGATNAKGNSSNKKDTMCRWQQDHGITRQVLQQLFDKSRDDAAKTLNVSPSTLKRACRDFGITRWPNHKRKRPNSSLNQKQAVQKHKGSQPCPEQATTTLQANSPAVSIKVSYKNATIRFPLSSSSTMKYLEEQLERKLKISLDNNFFIKYQDEEDEWITLTCDSELMHGMDVLRSSGKTVIRMEVSPKFD